MQVNKLGSLPLGSVIFRTIFQLERKGVGKIDTVRPRFNERFSLPRLIVKYMEKNLDVTKPRYSEHMLAVSWPFVISRFHCDLQSDGWPGVLPRG